MRGAKSRTEFIHTSREERGQTSREMSVPSFCHTGPFKEFYRMWESKINDLLYCGYLNIIKNKK